MSSKTPDDDPAAKATKPVLPAPAQPRLRVLAGPNGSGKSTIRPDLRPEWIGVFVNAGEMEKDLKASGGFLKLQSLGVNGERAVVLKRIRKSLKTFGLKQRLDMPALLAGIKLDAALTPWMPGPYNSYLAATLAEAVRQELFEEGQTFTFETVMSHRSKTDFLLFVPAQPNRLRQSRSASSSAWPWMARRTASSMASSASGCTRSA